MDIFRQHAALEPYFAKSYGCAAFKSVIKGGVGIGGAHGAGDVYKLVDGKEEHVAKVTLSQAELGVTLGYEEFAQIVFLHTEADFEKFMTGKFEFLADAEAAYVSAEASAHGTALKDKPVDGPEYKKGMRVFTVPTKGKAGGLFVNAAIGGQKFHIQK